MTRKGRTTKRPNDNMGQPAERSNMVAVLLRRAGSIGLHPCIEYQLVAELVHGIGVTRPYLPTLPQRTNDWGQGHSCQVARAFLDWLRPKWRPRARLH